MKFDDIIRLLHEFDYKKNGKVSSVSFLLLMAQYILNEVESDE